MQITLLKGLLIPVGITGMRLKLTICDNNKQACFNLVFL